MNTYTLMVLGMTISKLKSYFFRQPPTDDDDDDIVGHASFSDAESDDDDDGLDDVMRDFYEESDHSTEWLNLTDDEKRARLDAELDEYMQEGRKQLLDQIRC